MYEDCLQVMVYFGERDRRDGGFLADALFDLYERHELQASVLLRGAEGFGIKHRLQTQRLLSLSEDLPMVSVAIDSRERIEALLPELERVRVLKRDGELLAEPEAPPDEDEAGLSIWQKLTIYAGEQARVGDHPLYVELIRRLRGENAAGATAIRGIWGYHGDHAPHGDRLLSLARRVPVATIIVDRPREIARLWPIVDEATQVTGLVTSELVPAFRARSPDRSHGGLRLARPWC